MTTRREKEEQAKRLREDALKFLQEHPPSGASSQGRLKLRDNTFEQLREAQHQEVRPAAVQPAVTPVEKDATKSASLPAGWTARGMYLIHNKTGCALRDATPPIVMGGIECFENLPPGWKIILASKQSASDQKYFYWNASENVVQWTFPKAIPLRPTGDVLEGNARLKPSSVNTPATNLEQPSDEKDMDNPAVGHESKTEFTITGYVQPHSKKPKVASLFS